MTEAKADSYCSGRFNARKWTVSIRIYKIDCPCRYNDS